MIEKPEQIDEIYLVFKISETRPVLGVIIRTLLCWIHLIRSRTV